MVLKYITLKFILRYFYLNRNLADIGFLGLLWPIGSIKVPDIGLFYDPETPKYWDIQSSGPIVVFWGHIDHKISQ